LPAWSNSITGGAATQHFTFDAVDARFSLASSELGRWLIQIWSCASTVMPPMLPMIQLLGSGSGQLGSTWNFGGSARAGYSNAAATKAVEAILRPIRISSSRLLVLRLGRGLRCRGEGGVVNGLRKIDRASQDRASARVYHALAPVPGPGRRSSRTRTGSSRRR
jgi:hypothetical protein